MYLLEHNKDSGVVTNFKIELSEDGLMIYEGCINYVLEHCSNEDIYNITGCGSREELEERQKDIITILYHYGDRDLLSNRLLKLENRHVDNDDLLGLGIND